MKIKSSVKDYEVKFGNYEEYIKTHYSEGDIIVKDSKIELVGDYKIYVVDASEEEKEYTKLINLINYMGDLNFNKNNKIFALGGGVIQDICGFTSSIFHRGVDWIFIPTTLISQGDSCIGGKTSINTGKYKNQLGNIYPPSEICIDTNLLKTLPTEHINSGLGEMLHYFIFSSKNDFDFFVDNMNKDIESIIKRSLEIKKSVIEIDEREQGIRKLFNYGHTFGHALESITNYKIPHGIAVAIGMDISNYISYKMGFLDESIYQEIKQVLNLIKDNQKIKNIDVKQYFEILKRDKKNTNLTIRPILCYGYGELTQHSFTYDSELFILLTEYFNYE